jgi:(2Fe-2S) ferredoxin
MKSTVHKKTYHGLWYKRTDPKNQRWVIHSHIGTIAGSMPNS